MPGQDNPRYNKEFAHRFVLTCCALGKSKKWLQERTGWKKGRINHYEDGQIPPRKTFADLAKALDIPAIWLSMWLIDGDISALNDYQKDSISKFEALTAEEQLKRAQALGYLLSHGRPPKQQPPA